MTIQQLKYFISIYECGSYSAAAKKQYVSQQALSKSIYSLETELGKKIFVNTKKGIEKTEFCHFLYKKSISLVSRFNKMETDIYDYNEKVELNIVFSRGVLPRVGISSWIDFNNNNKDIILSKVEEEDQKCIDMIMSDEMDVGFVVKPIYHTDLEYKEYSSDEMFLICNEKHRLAKFDTISVSDFKDEIFVSFNKTYVQRKIIDEIGIKYGFKPNVGYESSEAQSVIQMVEYGAGISFVVEHFLKHIPQNVKIIKIKEFDFRWEIGFVYKKDSEKINEIIRFINSYYL